jgi:hypothetical protein
MRQNRTGGSLEGVKRESDAGNKRRSSGGTYRDFNHIVGERRQGDMETLGTVVPTPLWMPMESATDYSFVRRETRPVGAILFIFQSVDRALVPWKFFDHQCRRPLDSDLCP